MSRPAFAMATNFIAAILGIAIGISIGATFTYVDRMIYPPMQFNQE